METTEQVVAAPTGPGTDAPPVGGFLRPSASPAWLPARTCR
jgi:hypothetical protein